MRLLIIITILFCTTALAEEIGCGLEVIPKEKIEYGCGCGYWLATKPTLKPILQTENFDWSESFVHAKGNLVQATLVSSEIIPENPKLGDSFSQHYKIGEIEIIFKNIISFVCPPEGESCEVTSFKTNATIIGPQCKVELQNLKGDCGC